MFSVAGVDGEVFRGTLEHLLRVHPVTRARSAPSVADHGDAAGSEGSALGDTARYQRAADAYASSLGVQAQRGPIVHAFQIMSRGVVTLRPETSVEHAWLTLDRRSVGQAVVVDGGHRVLGLVSREHLLHALNAEKGRIRDILPREVKDVMASPVIAATPVTEVRRIARVMLEYSLPAVPVLDETGLLVGIVSRGDILKVVAGDPPLSLWA